MRSRSIQSDSLIESKEYKSRDNNYYQTPVKIYRIISMYRDPYQEYKNDNIIKELDKINVIKL
jgi:hypothetical protein